MTPPRDAAHAGRLRTLTDEYLALARRLQVGGGAKVVAAALRDAGMEVIYTGLHQTPEMIAAAAVQEDVDVVGLSILSGAHMTLFPRVRQLLDAQGRKDVLLTGGGILPTDDVAALEKLGTGRLFGPGTPTSDLVEYIQAWAAEHLKD